AEMAEFSFAGRGVKRCERNGHEFYFVPTDIALCRDYPRYLPEMMAHFADFDMSGMVTWHEGTHAPEHVLTVHSLGDVDSGYYGKANPRFMRNLLLAFEEQRKAFGLDAYQVVTEATHWSGVHGGEGDPSLLVQYPVPMVDIEVGSSPVSWEDDRSCRALARALFGVFEDDGKRVHNLLCVGGVHFEPNFAEAALTAWGDEAYAVTHIIANQWLVTGQYETEEGFRKACACMDAIEGGVDAIFFHDKMKGCYKDLVRRLGEAYQVPIYKHQKLRVPAELVWKK
ncbi:MAG: hypothetical protein IKU83_03755, partial [Lachnospiraceae bacterium]|nr:hypothetical protein [Lachnospiraceae bacterium]